MSDFCTCEETLVNGERIPKPPYHDCVYIRERSRLVPEAERLAWAIYWQQETDRQSPFTAKRRDKWNGIFARVMEEKAGPLLNGEHLPSENGAK